MTNTINNRTMKQFAIAGATALIILSSCGAVAKIKRLLSTIKKPNWKN
jgi:hypothetical protein